MSKLNSSQKISASIYHISKKIIEKIENSPNGHLFRRNIKTLNEFTKAAERLLDINARIIAPATGEQ